MARDRVNRKPVNSPVRSRPVRAPTKTPTRSISTSLRNHKKVAPTPHTSILKNASKKIAPASIMSRKFSDAAAEPDAAQKAKSGKIDINAVEDIFRSNRLAGLGDRYHQLNKAFDIIRSGEVMTPQLEADIRAVADVTSLRTASSREVRKAKTRALVEHYQRRPGDTGSPEVTAVLLTERVNYLKFHMTRHPTDVKLRKRYQEIIVLRRKTLEYLRRHRFRTYQILCRDLNVDEDEIRFVGRLPHTKPYYEPNKPIYRKPLTLQQLRDASVDKQIEGYNLEKLEKKQKKDAQLARTRELAQRARDFSV